MNKCFAIAARLLRSRRQDPLRMAHAGQGSESRMDTQAVRMMHLGRGLDLEERTWLAGLDSSVILEPLDTEQY